LGREVGVAEKSCLSSLNLVEKFGCTGINVRTIFQMGPDEAFVKRQQLGGRKVRPNVNKKAKFSTCHRSNTVNVLILGKAALNGD